MKRFLLTLVLVCAALASCTACVDEPGARRVLEADGVKDVRMIGYQYFRCGKDDSYSTGFAGVKNGLKVEGTVCSGFMKGYTVRYF
jgi:hypothetical protein